MKKITRKEQAFNTEQNIVKAMRVLLQTKSFQDIQIKDICSEASISNGNFYRYFQNKNSLIIRLIQFYEEEFYIIIEEVSNIDIRNQLNFLINSYAYVIQKVGKELIIEFHIYQLTTKYNILMSTSHPLYKSILKVLEELLSKNLILIPDTPQQLTRNIIIIFKGFLLEWVTTQNEYDFISEIQKQVSHYINLIIKQD